MNDRDEPPTPLPRRRVVTPRWAETFRAEQELAIRRRSRATSRSAKETAPFVQRPAPSASTSRESVFVTEPDWLLSMLATEPLDASPRKCATAHRNADDFLELVPQSLNARRASELDDEEHDTSTPAAAKDVVEAPPDAAEVLDRFHRRLRLADQAAFYAWQKLEEVPPLDALTSLAREALWVASRRFDPAHGLNFDDWAKFGIRRAIVDFLRNEGFSARHDRMRTKRTIAMESSGADDDAHAIEVRAEWAALAACVGPVFISTRRRLCDAVDRDVSSPEDLLADVERVRHVRAVLGSLRREDRILLERYFFQDLTLDEASIPFGISKSWASRRMGDAIAALKRALVRARVRGVVRSPTSVRELTA